MCFAVGALVVLSGAENGSMERVAAGATLLLLGLGLKILQTWREAIDLPDSPASRHEE